MRWGSTFYARAVEFVTLILALVIIWAVMAWVVVGVVGLGRDLWRRTRR